MRNGKKSFTIFFLFFLCIGYAQLPYSNETKNKSNSESNALVKMIDSLGYKYFGVTDSIMDEELSINFQSSKLKLILIEIYEASESIINSTSKNKTRKKLRIEEITFKEIRKNTLLNFEESKTNLAKNKEILLFLNFNSFIESVNSAKAFCDEIISFRKYLNKPYIPKSPTKKGGRSLSKIFDQSRGADGLTNDQWLIIMRNGGGSEAPDLIRLTNRKNQEKLIELEKKGRVYVEAGEIQNIETFSNVVDGNVYIYRDFPPEQLSYLFSSDNELIKELVNWVIFINSGNPTKLSRIFRIGSNENNIIERNQIVGNDLIREINDKKNNRIRLELPKNYFDPANFSDIKIEIVKLEDDQIKFYGQQYNDNKLGERLQPVFIIRNVNGNLLTRIKLNINQMRKGLNEYDNSIMNLNKY